MAGGGLVFYLGRPPHEHGGELLLLLSGGLFAFIGTAAWRLWFASWRATRGGWEYIRFDGDGVHWSLHGQGSGFVAYEWIRSVGGVRGVDFYVQYRRPEDTGVLPQTVCLDLRRIRGAGLWPGETLERELWARCGRGRGGRV